MDVWHVVLHAETRQLVRCLFDERLVVTTIIEGLPETFSSGFLAHIDSDKLLVARGCLAFEASANLADSRQIQRVRIRAPCIQCHLHSFGRGRCFEARCSLAIAKFSLLLLLYR